MTVTIESETEVPFDFEYEQTAREVIAQAMDSEEFPYEAEVNLLLVDNDIIHELNLEHRGIDRATDVLSFPMLDYQEAGDFSAIGEEQEWNCNPDTGEILLGDIIISVPKVLEQAKEDVYKRQAQKVAHQAFVDRLNEVNLEAVDGDQEGYLHELIEFLLGWLANHILKMDKKIPMEG